MATKQKYYYYVMVFTSEGPKYVTGTGEGHTAFWNVAEKPMHMSKDYAFDMMRGLTWNGHHSVVVTTLWELDSHGYNYDEYTCKFEKKNN